MPIWRIAAFPLVIAFECFLLLYVYHCIRPFLGIVFFCPIICTFISEVKMAGDEVEPEAKYCSERKGSTCRQIHPMPQFVQVGIITIQLVFLLWLFSVNNNKDSNVVIEHKCGHCNNVIEVTIMIISIRLESDHCLLLTLTD